MNSNTETLKTKPTFGKPVLADSILIQETDYKAGDFIEEREIKTVYKLELFINHLGVIAWYLYDSNQPHKTRWLDGAIKEVHDYYFSNTAYYTDTPFERWPHYLHKDLPAKIAENCGFESPRVFADYLIKTYKEGFKGQLISFKDIQY